MTRREFLQITLAMSAAPMVGCGGAGGASVSAPVTTASLPTPLPTRALGRTGERVSIVGLGGWHMGVQTSGDESVAIVRAAIDGGITFLDNCWDYNGGESEKRMGRALRDGYRDKVFLMSKIDGRDRTSATRQLDESLQRLGTDRIDLMQIHEIIRDEDPDRVFASGGAIEALVEARRSGKIRFIGFTGHKSPRWHLKMLRVADDHGFAFDTLQMPLNVLDAHYDSFEKNVLPVAVQKGLGVIGMKPMANGLIVNEALASAEDCLAYAMSLPTSVVITGCDSLARVDQALRVARGFQPLSESRVDELLARTEARARDGGGELYKTTEVYDGTTQNPDWLG